VTTIAVWSAFITNARDVAASLPDDHVLVIENESDLSRVGDAEVVLSTGNGERARKLIAATPNLRWYHSVRVGVDDLVGLREFRDRGIVLTNNSGSYDIQIAEHVMAFILGAAKRLHVYRDQQARREWKEHRQQEVRDATVVVFGIGSIGSEVARLASGLGMRVIGIRRNQGAVPGVARIVPPERLADAAAEADYLVVAAPLTAATRGAVSGEVIARMKKTAWIVNIARGPIVDEDALARALAEERIGGAAIDAFSEEPLPAASPLWGLPNAVLTPHTSNSSPQLGARTLALFLENMRRYKAGEPLLNRVDLEAGY
jgi:phosphoglycerate dehydrogenase-like enzyme